MTDSTEVATTSNDAVTALEGMRSGATVWHTFTGSDFETNKQIFAAVSDAKSLNENYGTVINLKNAVAQVVEVQDAQTKSMQEIIRTVLIDEDGTAYASTSQGVFGALKTLFGIMGYPSTWDSEAFLPIVASEGKSRMGMTYATLKLA